MIPDVVAPAFGGKGCPFLNYDQRVRLWRQVANLDFALIRAIVAREVSMSAGSEIISSGDVADQVPSILREYFAPGAAGSFYQDVVRFLQFKRPGQPADVSVVEFDVLRRKAASKMRTDGGFPEAFVSI